MLVALSLSCEDFGYHHHTTKVNQNEKSRKITIYLGNKTMSYWYLTLVFAPKDRSLMLKEGLAWLFVRSNWLFKRMGFKEAIILTRK